MLYGIAKTLGALVVAVFLALALQTSLNASTPEGLPLYVVNGKAWDGYYGYPWRGIITATLESGAVITDDVDHNGYWQVSPPHGGEVTIQVCGVSHTATVAQFSYSYIETTCKRDFYTVLGVVRDEYGHHWSGLVVTVTQDGIPYTTTTTSSGSWAVRVPKQGPAVIEACNQRQEITAGISPYASYQLVCTYDKPEEPETPDPTALEPGQQPTRRQLFLATISR